MLKKAILCFAAIICTFSAAYAYGNHSLNAATNTYHAGGNVTGRISQMPVGLTSATSGLQKGDKILTNVDNTYTSDKLAWQLLSYQTYSDYECTTTTTCTGKPEISNWYAMSDKAIGKTTLVDTLDKFEQGKYGLWKTINFKNTNLYPALTDFNTLLKNSNIDKTFIAPRNLYYLHAFYQDALAGNMKHYVDQVDFSTFSTPEFMGDSAYIPAYYEAEGLIQGLGVRNLETKDYAFSEDYFWANSYHDTTPPLTGICHYFAYFAQTSGVTGNAGLSINKSNSVNNLYAIRPAIYLDLDNTVFAVSRGTAAGNGMIHLTKLTNGYTSLYAETTEDTTNGKNMPMKLRMYNSSLTAQMNDIQLLDGTSISKIVQDKTIQLSADANAGNDGNGGVYTLSVIVFDENNDFVYYQPLDDAKGNDNYQFDLTGIAPGKYKIAVVNEAYNEALTSPADSSYISNTMPLEIVEKLSINATAKTGLEYSKNVNQNDVVATFTTKGGVSPITTTLVSDTSVSGHSNDYQLFSLSGSNVIVKDMQGLNAGDYYFKINAIDVNGDPTGGIDSAAVHIQVKKTKPTIAFTNTSTTKKSISDAGTAWNETATATPSIGTKVTYSVSGGDVGLIDIDPNTGAITYKGGNAFGKVKIKATADDDPSSGDDNYDPIDTEKEIIIYREVDGNVTPDNNSSDSTIPTFSASDPNVKINGIIGTIQGTLGTPDTLGGSTTTYTYGLKAGSGDANFFSVDPNTGVIKATANLGVKGYSITVTVSDKWSTKEIPVSINVGVANAEDLKFYENSTSNTVITTQSAKITDTNVFVYATVKGSSNTNPVTYKVKDGSTNIVEVNTNSGKITPKGVGTVTIVAEKAGASGQANAVAELTFTVTAGEQDFIYTDATLSNELPKSGSHYDPYVETYGNGKTFQLYTAGYPIGASVTYQLKAGSPTDVISVDSNGLVHILNASLNNQMGKVIVEATSHDPSNHYTDKTIELPINIEKGTRVISFADDPIYVINGKGSVTPITEVDGNIDTDGDVLIEVDANEDGSIAWTNDNKTIQYNYSGTDAKDIKIHATKPMDRNYKAAEADGTIHIMGPDENILAITSPGQIIYGDHFTIRSTQYDAGSTNVQYQFEIDDTTYLSAPTVNGNIAEFDAIKYSGNKKTTIKVTRTADGETPLSKTISVQVLPKEIEITIDDKEKYKGEENPQLTYQDFKSQLVSWNGVQDVIQEHDIKLSTIAQTNSQAGNYPIKGDVNSLNNTYPNYSFKFVDGTLEIKEDNIEDDWYHMEIADGSHTPYNGDWTNQDVTIISDHTEYVNLSLDQSTWNPQKVTVSKEGETNQSFWMKKDSGAITKEKQEIIRIDKTPPKVKGIKAKDSNNQVQDIINKLSAGIFFKPGTAFEITTSDENGDLKVSGTKEISYKIYKLQTTARSDEEEISSGSLSVTDEKANITISETSGTYRVCVIPTDHAGNSGEESCHEVTLKKINIDVDGDGEPDFNDPDGDGCPDLNIVLGKDEDGIDIKLNIDNDGDGIPELNIDTNGDGKADINVDQDGDGKPDLNIASHITWNPNYCVIGQAEEYCTDQSIIPDLNIDIDGDGRPDINVDLDHDGIPDIDIDTDGDGKADINIDKNKDGTPDENITKLTEWEPDESFEVNGTKYQTMMNLKPDEQIKTDKPSVTDKPAKPQNTNVQGNYYPGNSIGGANTGDTTRLMMYLGISLGSLGILFFVIYKKKEEN